MSDVLERSRAERSRSDERSKERENDTEKQRSETFPVTVKQAQISPLYILKEDIIQAGINAESICSDDLCMA